MRVRTGFSLTEVLITIAVMTCLILFVLWTNRSTATADAQRLTAILLELRFTAVTSGVSTAAPVATCDSGLNSARPVPMPTSIVTWPPRGLLFTPDGLPRTCDGGGVGNTTILLEHRGRQAAVIVSSLGRVRWELR